MSFKLSKLTQDGLFLGDVNFTDASSNSVAIFNESLITINQPITVGKDFNIPSGGVSFNSDEIKFTQKTNITANLDVNSSGEIGENLSVGGDILATGNFFINTNIYNLLPLADQTDTTSKYAPGALAPNGKIYCPPYDANTILEIDTNVDPPTLTEFGDSGAQSTEDRTNTFDNDSTVGYTSGCFRESDGLIYCFPDTATSIISVNPDTEVVTSLAPSGDALSSVTNSKYFGTVLGKNGLVYGIPHSAEQVMVYDPDTNTLTALGLGTLGTNEGSVGKFFNGTLASNGYIYGCPHNLGYVLSIDTNVATPSSGDVVLIPATGMPIGIGYLAGAADDPINKRIWFAPCLTVPYNHNFSTGSQNETMAAYYTYSAGATTGTFAIENGNISRFTGIDKFRDCLYYNGFIYFIPYNYPRLCQHRPEVNTPVKFIYNNASDQATYFGAVMDNDGLMYLIPANTSSSSTTPPGVLQLNANTDPFTLQGYLGADKTFATSTQLRKFANAVLASNGLMYAFPQNGGGGDGDGILRISPPLSTVDLVGTGSAPTAAISQITTNLYDDTNRYFATDRSGYVFPCKYDNKMYAFPNSQSVNGANTTLLIIDLATDTDESIDLSTLGLGITSSHSYSGAVAGDNGKIYSIPWSSSDDGTKILEYDPNTGNVTEVLEVSTGRSYSAKGVANQGFLGGALAYAPTGDGKIYCAPYNFGIANELLTIDTSTSTATFEFITIAGTGMNTNQTTAYAGCCYSPIPQSTTSTDGNTGAIYFAPYATNNTDYAYYLLENNTGYLYGEPSGGQKFYGCVYRDPGYIIYIPYNYNNITYQYITPGVLTPSQGNFGDPIRTVNQGYFQGGVMSGTLLYIFPATGSSQIEVWDTECLNTAGIRGTFELVQTIDLNAGETTDRYSGGVIGDNNVIYACPYNASTGIARVTHFPGYMNGCTNDNYYYALPAYGTRRLYVMNLVTEEVTEVDISSIVSVTDTFYGTVMGANGYAYGIPFGALYVLEFNVTAYQDDPSKDPVNYLTKIQLDGTDNGANIITTNGLYQNTDTSIYDRNTGKGWGWWRNGALAKGAGSSGNGKIFCAPYNYNYVLSIDTNSGPISAANIEAYQVAATFPAPNSSYSSFWSNAVDNPVNSQIWFSPYGAFTTTRNYIAYLDYSGSTVPDPPLNYTSPLDSSPTGWKKFKGTVYFGGRVFHIPYNYSVMLSNDVNTNALVTNVNFTTSNQGLYDGGLIIGTNLYLVPSNVPTQSGIINGIPVYEMSNTTVNNGLPLITYLGTTDENITASTYRKFSGAVLDPAKKIAYCLPNGSQYSLKINPGTTQGYINGCILDDKIYCFPADATTMLEYDTNLDQVRNISMSHLTTLIDVTDKFYASVVGADGKIYGIPFNAKQVIVYDPNEADSSTNPKLIGTDLTQLSGVTATAGFYWGGALGNDGKIYCCPHNMRFVLSIDTNNTSAADAIVTYETTEGGLTQYNLQAFVGAVNAPTDPSGDPVNVIYFAPYGTGGISGYGYYKYTSGSSPKYGTSAGFTGAQKFKGLVFYNGYVYFIPYTYGYPTNISIMGLIASSTGNGSTPQQVMNGSSVVPSGSANYQYGTAVVQGNLLFLIPQNATLGILQVDMGAGGVGVGIWNNNSQFHLGNTVPEVYAPITNKWNGAVLNERTGKMYAFPENASFPLEFEAISEIGSGSNQYSGAVLGKNGKIYGIPYDSDFILEIDPETRAFNQIVQDISGTSKWAGGCLGFDGNIYGIPNNTANILQIDTNNDIATISTSTTTNDSQNGLSYGGAIDENGKIYCAPYNRTSDVLVINTNGTIGTSTINFDTAPSTTSSAYKGAVYGGDGNIYCVPFNAQEMLSINTSNGTTSLLSSSIFTSSNYFGGVSAPDGFIYLIPNSVNPITRFDPANQDFITIGDAPSSSTAGYNGGCLGLNGKIYGIPSVETNVLEIPNVSDGVLPSYLYGAYRNKF